MMKQENNESRKDEKWPGMKGGQALRVWFLFH
jgi:hypothetical protein